MSGEGGAFPVQSDCRLRHYSGLPILLKQLANIVVLAFVVVILPHIFPQLLCHGGTGFG